VPNRGGPRCRQWRRGGRRGGQRGCALVVESHLPLDALVEAVRGDFARQRGEGRLEVADVEGVNAVEHLVVVVCMCVFFCLGGYRSTV
jgi:hypothetical protein